MDGIIDAFMRMHAEGGVPGHYDPPPPEQDHDDGVHYVFERGDPLARFPRVMKPHLFMPEVRSVALDPRLFDTVEELLDEQALLSYTMFYFKPPGSRGQAFHQDNFYLKVKPGTCCAVWIACDRADAENGGLSVVPRSHELEIVCPEFTSVCPKTGQPDFGTITFTYTPGEKCVELKSLKLYLQRYRNRGIFYEAVTNQILDDLVAACSPRRMTVVGDFSVRGGISTLVTATYTKS